MDDPVTVKPSTLRMRRCRARQLRQAILLKIEIDAQDVEALVNAGLLDADQRHDRDAIAGVVWRLIELGFKSSHGKANAAAPPAASNTDASPRVSPINQRIIPTLDR
jgi:hypothetical protein